MHAVARLGGVQPGFSKASVNIGTFFDIFLVFSTKYVPISRTRISLPYTQSECGISARVSYEQTTLAHGRLTGFSRVGRRVDKNKIRGSPESCQPGPQETRVSRVSARPAWFSDHGPRPSPAGEIPILANPARPGPLEFQFFEPGPVGAGPLSFHIFQTRPNPAGEPSIFCKSRPDREAFPTIVPARGPWAGPRIRIDVTSIAVSPTVVPVVHRGTKGGSSVRAHNKAPL